MSPGSCFWPFTLYGGLLEDVPVGRSWAAYRERLLAAGDGMVWPRVVEPLRSIVGRPSASCGVYGADQRRGSSALSSDGTSRRANAAPVKAPAAAAAATADGAAARTASAAPAPTASATA